MPILDDLQINRCWQIVPNGLGDLRLELYAASALEVAETAHCEYAEDVVSQRCTCRIVNRHMEFRPFEGSKCSSYMGAIEQIYLLHTFRYLKACV